ncbi:TonB-dependent receptor family [Azotobacter vinelandii CA]|uniref:TonB-dependent receptor family n=2 Tax=Azotobacter vinelandii TaxID=354 RepID=C1DGL9_AZOVD|nr:TonB-dependent receptor [Azotobacter vinelandii]ACO80515.1 TonB-dependent receptor family [Azotobacter vinelandii DJ]AGK14377.1 TonB-dependent receptor family [Azotobacter vinelandii CA]AGK21967.1 TonB-dependent receptor family [Azotobacter vinelandii CA6]SFX36034.1 iron complex outermembrane recepter protein [Azotobacter vinelandii]GLK58558.1 TonB-dependent receptor [Azotobacter vinelandii]
MNEIARPTSFRDGLFRGSPGKVAMALLLAHGQLYAQEDKNEENPTLGTVVVQHERLTPAEQARTRIENIPGGASVVDSAQVELGKAATVQDILAYQPGVFVQSVGGNDAIKVSIRGSGIQSAPGNMTEGIKFLFDGLALTGPGGTSYELFEPLGLDHTEVLRGANAFDYGAVTLGGAINFVSANGLNAPGTRVHVEGGKYGYRKAFAGTGGTLGDADYHFSVKESRRDGFQRQTFKRAEGLSANLGYRFSPDLESRLILRYNEEFHEQSAPLTRARLHHDPSDTTSAYRVSRSNVDKYGSFLAGLKTTWQIDDHSLLEVGLAYYKYPQKLNRYSTTPSTSDYRDLNPSIRYIRNDTLFGLPSETIASWYYTRHVKGETDAYQRNADGSLTHTKKSRYKGSYDNVFVLGNTLDLTRDLKLLTGLTAIQVRRDVELAYSAAPINSGYSDRVNYDNWSLAPRLGLSWQLNPTLQVFANASRSINPVATWGYSPSTFSTAVNFVKQLEEQKANTLEVGLRVKTERLDGSLVLYRSWLRDELLTVELSPTTETSSALVTTSNADKTMHQGVEAGLAATLWEHGGHRLSLRQAYTFSDFRFRGDDSFGSNYLPNVPRHIYQAELHYQQAGGFYASLNVQARSDYYIDYANTFKSNGYALLGARLGYQAPQRKWSVFLDGSNLTDREYASSTNVVYDAQGKDTASFYPGDGIGVVAGLDFRF